ncbi:hypothetical protein [Anatilimnocola aggregata]|uniref:hypothetical protein n=1 Tax=Anatilimnocola aggregata TaxID=2528021 RepID=UPI00119F679E|nr:hypothetical protein [Anatilimnocola aggregata]
MAVSAGRDANSGDRSASPAAVNTEKNRPGLRSQLPVLDAFAEKSVFPVPGDAGAAPPLLSTKALGAREGKESAGTPVSGPNATPWDRIDFGNTSVCRRSREYFRNTAIFGPIYRLSPPKARLVL